MKYLAPRMNLLCSSTSSSNCLASLASVVVESLGLSLMSMAMLTSTASTPLLSLLPSEPLLHSLPAAGIWSLLLSVSLEPPFVLALFDCRSTPEEVFLLLVLLNDVLEVDVEADIAAEAVLFLLPKLYCLAVVAIVLAAVEVMMEVDSLEATEEAPEPLTGYEGVDERGLLLGGASMPLCLSRWL